MKRRLVLLVGILLITSFFSLESFAVACWNGEQLTLDEGYQCYPKIFESHIIYMKYLETGQIEMYMYDLGTGTETKLPLSEASWDYSFYDDKVVWSKGGWENIFLYDISTGVETQITFGAGGNDLKSFPAIYGNNIVWEDGRSGGAEIYLYDLVDNSEHRVSSIDHSAVSPQIYKNIIVWQGMSESNWWDIYMYDMGPDKRFGTLDDGGETHIVSAPGTQAMPVVFENTIVWMDDRNYGWDIYSYDLTTNTEKRIIAGSNPIIYGDKILYDDEYGGVSLYDLTSDSTLVTKRSWTGADIYEDTIVYHKYLGDYNADIFAVSVLLGDSDCIFGDASNYPAGGSPSSVAIDDLNNDGNLDLAVANAHSDNVSVLLGNGNGAFEAAANYAAGDWPLSVAIGDLNNDGILDLAVANDDSGDVSVLRGIGDGTFATAVNYPAGSYPFSVAIGDLNKDGNLDLAVANYWSDNVSVLLGIGDGTFATVVNYPAGDGPSSVAIDDLDKDGNLDLAVANYLSHDVSLLRGIGDGTFASAVNYPAGDGPYSVAIGDLDKDGNLDLAVANYYTEYVSVLLGYGDATFQAPSYYPAENNPSSVAIGDLNKDTNPDLAVTNYDTGAVSVLLGNGDGSFQIATYYPAESRCSSVAIGDLNNDGNPDLAVTNNMPGVVVDNVSVFLSRLSPCVDTDGDGLCDPDDPDDDNDGIADDQDDCPYEDPTGFDQDADGCIDSISGLTDLVTTLLDEGVISEQMHTSLLSKIGNAEKSATKLNICAAAHQLEALIQEVNAQRGKKISDEAADQIITYTQSVINWYLSQLPEGETC
jgi:beta propeller repeat protein